MTKEELARKKGIKLSKEKQSPSDSLVTTKNAGTAPSDEAESKKKSVHNEPEKTTDDAKPVSPLKTAKNRQLTSQSTSEAATSPAKSVSDNKENAPSSQPVSPLKKHHAEAAEAAIPPASVIEEKRGPGKPKKRKSGDKKISFWLDEDLVHGLYDHLSYGESAGEAINVAIREYQKNHGVYRP